MFILEHIDVPCVDPDLGIRCPNLLINKQSDIFITDFKSDNVHANDISEVIISYMPFYGSLKDIHNETFSTNLPRNHKKYADPISVVWIPNKLALLVHN